MFEKIKNTIKAEAQKDAQKLKKAIEDTKKGVKGAKEEATKQAERIAKNTAVSPLLPFIPAMLYLLKKEKGLTYSAKKVATERYLIVEDFYNQIVEPHFNPKPSNVGTKKKKLSSFDMIEMTSSDFDHVDEETAFIPMQPTTEATTESALQDVFSSAVEGGKQGAKMGAGLGTFLAGVGVPPPVSNLAGASAGAQMGAIIGSIVKFFKLGLTKVKDALDKTKTSTDAIISGGEIVSEDLGTGSGSFDFKKLLLPLVAVVAIYFFVIKKK